MHVHIRPLVVKTRQMIPSGAYLDRDCFVAVLLAMTSTYSVIASEAKQSRRGPAREQASGLHHQMPDTGIAKIFMHGRSQAVRLPLAFRLPGDRVRVRRVKSGILLEPMVTDIDAWFAELDRFADVPFMEAGRRQPPMVRSSPRYRRAHYGKA